MTATTHTDRFSAVLGNRRGTGAQAWFDVVLIATGERRIKVIKVLRAASGLGLREEKELTDVLPSLVGDRLDVVEATSLQADLEEAGATVIVR